MDSKKKKQIGIISLIVIGVLLGLLFSVKALIGDYGKETDGPIYSTAKVIKGDINVGVKAKGQLQPSGDGRIELPYRNYYFDTQFTIEEILVEEGDSVTEGQLLVKMSADSLDKDVQAKEDDLDTLLDELSQMTGKPKSQVESVNPSEGVVLTSPIDGRITNFDISVGDTLKVTTIARIVDDSKFKVKAKFTAGEVSKITEGTKLLLDFPYFGGYIEGTVTSISSSPIPVDSIITPDSDSSDTNTQFATGFAYVAYIEAENPGLVQQDMDLRVATQASDGSGISFFKHTAYVDKFMKEENLLNRIEDTIVTDIHVDNFQSVKKGDPIVSLSGKDMQNRIREILDRVRRARRDIEQLKEQYKNLEVYSNKNGIVSYIEKKVGEQLDGPWDSLGEIYNTDRMDLWVRVDDIDIINVRQGASVAVTVDAVPGEIFEGTVSHVSSRGSESGGVTKFDVYIDVTGGPGLRPGMQATAQVDAGEAKDVLLVPIEAVFEENGEEMVEILVDGIPKTIKITTGLMNDRFAEVTEGLEAEQMVITGSSSDLLPSEHIQSDNFMPSNGSEGENNPSEED
ncbi:MAG: HlyD family efflux transporter periplasmic adaptor subunit [Clostridia bacterium]|nr:HlyD family efflux transporter periplasmic adaptor subunit [Clostridia bacterium]